MQKVALKNKEISIKFMRLIIFLSTLVAVHVFKKVVTS